MKKLVSLAVSLLMVALLCFFTAALAQEPAAAPSPAGTVKKEPAVPIPDRLGIPYKRVRVIKGGNLSDIAERCGYRMVERISPNGERTYKAGWRPLYDVNPNLPKPEKIGDMWRVWVHPGQILNLPAGWSYGTLDPEYVEPFPSAHKEARGPEGTTPPMPPEEPQKVVGTAPGTGGSLWRLLDPEVWVLILLILVAIAFLATIAAPFIRRRDPSRYPVRVNGGLSADMDTAVRQLGIAYPGRRYTRIERCRLVRGGGSRRILVRRMDFGDGVSRDAYLNDGDQVYRGTLPGGGFDYFLRSCGNFGPEFTLPAGWRVVVIQSQDVAPTVYEPPMSAAASAAPVPPAPPVAPVLPFPLTPPVPIFSDEPEPAPEPALATVPAEPSAPAAEPPATEEAVPVENHVVDGLKGDCRQLSRRRRLKKRPLGRQLCTFYNGKKTDFVLKLEYK